MHGPDMSKVKLKKALFLYMIIIDNRKRLIKQKIEVSLYGNYGFCEKNIIWITMIKMNLNLGNKRITPSMSGNMNGHVERGLAAILLSS